MNHTITKEIWKTYGIWALWVGVAFFSVYPTCNWLTSQRENPFHIYFNGELSIPFIPDFIWIYLSMYLLFLAPPFFLNIGQLIALGKQLIWGTLFSGLAFLLFPAQLGFTRVIPSSDFYQQLYANLFAIDLPHNLVPSLHIVFSALIQPVILALVAYWEEFSLVA